VFDTFDPILEIGKSFCLYHHFCGEVFEAFYTHAHHIRFCEVEEITGALKAKGISILTEYDCFGAAVSNMSADDPDGNVPMFLASFFYGHTLP
jgi:hypothetical protein